MGTNFFRSLIAGLILMLIFSTITFAADYVHRVIFINEGYNDFNTGQQLVPVTVAAYDPSSKTYAIIDTIENQRFASDVVIEGDYMYVAADMILVKYDRYTLQKVSTQAVSGIRNIAAWNDKLIVTRGEVGGLSSYFQVYNQSDLSFDYELDLLNGPAYATQNVIIIDDKAYVVVNNGFEWGNPKGFIGIVALITRSYSEVDLGPDGLNPDNLMLDGDNLYTLNNKDFTGSSVSSFNLTNGTVGTTNLANVTTGCGTSAFFTNYVWYQQYGSYKVHAFNPGTQQVADSATLNKEFYGMEVDPVNNLLYATTTDFVSTGMAYIYDANRALVDSFAVGVSAGNIAFDVRNTTGIKNIDKNNGEVNVYPNPSNDILNIEVKNFKADLLEVLDISGKRVFIRQLSGAEKTSLDVSSFSEGMYYVIMTGADRTRAMTKFIRQ